MGLIVLIFAMTVLIAAGVSIFGEPPSELRPVIWICAGIIIAAEIFALICRKFYKVCKNIRALKTEKMRKPNFVEAVDHMTGNTYTRLENGPDQNVSEKAQKEIQSAYAKGERFRNSRIFRQVLLLLFLLVIMLAILVCIAVAVYYIYFTIRNFIGLSVPIVF